MIRTVQLSEITENIKEMCIEANHFLSPDMAEAMKQAQQNEKSPLGKQILGQLQENLEIAAQDRIPICQDTGMPVVFLEIGQDVHFEGGSLEEAVNEGVRQGYVEGYLRKSVVGDPLIRENTKDNTPAVLHIRIVEGDRVKIKVAPKGFGSENMSRVFMLKPAEGIEGVKDAVLTAVKDAEVIHLERRAPAPPTAAKYTEPFLTIASITAWLLLPFPTIAPSPRSSSCGAYLSILLAVVGPADPIGLPSLAGDGPI